jgi:archaellum component FlaC
VNIPEEIAAIRRDIEELKKTVDEVVKKTENMTGVIKINGYPTGTLTIDEDLSINDVLRQINTIQAMLDALS